jgi:hypothetical protein
MHTILINNIVKDTHLAGVTILINNIVKDTHLAGVGSRRRRAHGAAATGERGGGGRSTGRRAWLWAAATHGQRNGRRAGENETARGSDPR